MAAPPLIFQLVAGPNLDDGNRLLILAGWLSITGLSVNGVLPGGGRIQRQEQTSGDKREHPMHGDEYKESLSRRIHWFASGQVTPFVHDFGVMSDHPLRSRRLCHRQERQLCAQNRRPIETASGNFFAAGRFLGIGWRGERRGSLSSGDERPGDGRHDTGR